jgi:hypothetical protein
MSFMQVDRVEIKEKHNREQKPTTDESDDDDHHQDSG